VAVEAQALLMTTDLVLAVTVLCLDKTVEAQP
jgi:hypothetical protein